MTETAISRFYKPLVQAFVDLGEGLHDPKAVQARVLSLMGLERGAEGYTGGKACKIELAVSNARYQLERQGIVASSKKPPGWGSSPKSLPFLSGEVTVGPQPQEEKPKKAPPPPPVQGRKVGDPSTQDWVSGDVVSLVASNWACSGSYSPSDAVCTEKCLIATACRRSLANGMSQIAANLRAEAVHPNLGKAMDGLAEVLTSKVRLPVVESPRTPQVLPFDAVDMETGALLPARSLVVIKEGVGVVKA